MDKERKYFCHFVDLERQSLLPTYPKRDQNHVVRGKKPSDLFWSILKFGKKRS